MPDFWHQSGLDILPHTNGSFEFAKDSPVYQEELPYEVVGILPPEQEAMRSNMKWESRKVPVYDLREQFNQFSIEKDGFEYVHHPELGVSKADLTTEKGLEDHLLKALEFLKRRFNAEHVIIWNYNFRKSGFSTNKEATSGTFEAPSPFVQEMHTDGSRDGGPRRIRRHLNEEEADKYFDGSWHLRMITVWRPTHVVADNPLAICHPATVSRSDLIATARVSPDFTAEVNYLKYSPKQRFYYLSKQKPDEMLIFTAYDSENDCSLIVPHASFVSVDSDRQTGAKDRESFDFRAIVMKKKGGVKEAERFDG